MISARIIADSTCNGSRITTFVLKYPRFIHSEIMTHRVFSRNSASSRAIPTKKLRSMVLRNPAFPIFWGKTQKGMQANNELSGWRKFFSKKLWFLARYPACFIHWLLERLNLHKQITNRLLEPWFWMEIVLTGTEFKNFFNLRNHADAQPEFKYLASIMQTEYTKNIPEELQPNEWHLPFVNGDEKHYLSILDQLKVSAARCARVSYYLFDKQKKSTLYDDITLCDKLFGSNPRHCSPAEHPAQAIGAPVRSANFVGWTQYRKTFKDEAGGDYAI